MLVDHGGLLRLATRSLNLNSPALADMREEGDVTIAICERFARTK
jgi:hypothetical protein